MFAAALSFWLAAAAQIQAPSSPQAAGPDTVVVCPAEFRPALQPWVELRTAEGHSLRIVSNDGTAENIRARIRTAAREGKLRYVLLVGAADPKAIRHLSIPAHLEPAVVNVRWGSEPTIAADNWYADLDDDGVPDVAIGRLTVRSAAELQTVVRKIVAYEQSRDFHRWRSRINFVAGAGGFGPLVDSVLEAGARQLIAGGIPAQYQTTLTAADWHSPYCPDPRQFHATTLARINEGCWFWVYLGHARRTALDELRVPNGHQPILDRADAAGLHCAGGPPIGLLLACYAGAFDGEPRCLADELLRADGGPVAIVAGSRVTMPYGMTVLGSELLDECFERHAPTLGDALLHAKRRIVDADGPSLSPRRMAFDAVARAVGPAGTDLPAERREHLQLFNLIGDPLLRLHYPRAALLTLAPTATAGSQLSVAGQSPIDGDCTIELVPAPARSLWQPPARQQYDPSAAAMAAYQAEYLAANGVPVATVIGKVAAGHFTAAIPLPPGKAGRYLVRVFIAGRDDFAIAAANLEVQRLESQRSAATPAADQAGAIHR